MKTWFLIYILSLGYTEVEVSIPMPDEATCLESLGSVIQVSEVLAGPPDPNNLRGLYRKIHVWDKRCRQGEF